MHRVSVRSRRCALAIFATGLCLTSVASRRADADEPDTELSASEAIAPAEPSLKPYVFEAAGRAGFVSAPIRGGVNPFGAGFGGRAGVTVSNVYLGASAVDFLGGSDGAATDHAVLAGVELGYSVRVGSHFTLRPIVGVGDTLLFHTEPSTSAAAPSVNPTVLDVVSAASGLPTPAPSPPPAPLPPPSSGRSPSPSPSPSPTPSPSPSPAPSTSPSGSSGMVTTVKNIYVEPRLMALFAYGNFFAAVGLGALVVPGIQYGPPPAQATTWLSYSIDGQLGLRL